MIEADVLIGSHLRDASPSLTIPIMSHPPKNESNLSLQEFLTTISAHNAKNSTKGVKLDFKTIEVFNESLPLLKNLWRKVKNAFTLLPPVRFIDSILMINQFV